MQKGSRNVNVRQSSIQGQTCKQDIEEFCVIIKDATHQEDITVVKLYTTSNITANCIKEKHQEYKKNLKMCINSWWALTMSVSEVSESNIFFKVMIYRI